MANILVLSIKKILIPCFLYAIYSIFLLSTAFSMPVYKIKKIQIEGCYRIPEQSVRSYLKINIGDNHNDAETNAGIKRLYATNFYKKISTDFIGSDGVLIIKLNEKEIINSIIFEGNKKISGKILLKSTELSPSADYSSSSFKKDLDIITSLYRKKGFYAVSISHDLVKIGKNKVDVRYYITEGEKVKIKKILFIGNKQFTSRQLKDVIFSRESKIRYLFSNRDVFDPDRLSVDKELLTQYYHQNGYQDFIIKEINTEIASDKTSAIISINISEGKQYKIGNAKILAKAININVLPLQDEVNSLIHQFFNKDLITSYVKKINVMLKKQSKLLLEAKPYIQSKDYVVDVVFKIQKLPRVEINTINIQNNSQTIDKVIRNKITFSEGDTLDLNKISESKSNILRLGHFQDVNADIKSRNETDINKVDITFSVHEQKTGAYNFGAGYSSNDGLFSQLSLSQSNLLGTGKEVQIGFNKSNSGLKAAFEITSPTTFGRNLLTNLNVGLSNNELYNSSNTQNKNHTINRLFLETSLGYPLLKNLYHHLSYRISRNKSYAQNESSQFLQSLPIENNISAIKNSLNYSTLDNIRSPTKGTIFNISHEVSLPLLNGNNLYTKQIFQAALYKPVIDNTILKLSAAAGIINGIYDKKVRVDEGFFIGMQEVAGFAHQGIGPRDNQNGQALGAKRYILGKAQLTFPLSFAQTLNPKLVLFTEAGTAFDIDIPDNSTLSAKNYHDGSDLRISCGLGMILDLPIGTLRLDFAHPLRKTNYDKTEMFRFSLGKASHF